jgi:hypothetical protein
MKTKKNILLILLFITMILLASYWLFIYENKTQVIKGTDSTGQQTKGEAPLYEEESIKTESLGSENNNPKKESEHPVTNIIKPTGNFVSSHRVKKDSLIASSCVTNPGISCKITFSQEDTVVSLEPTTTDSGGAAYWEWTPEKIGLTAGEWIIESVAYDNSNSAASKDSVKLSIAP